MEGSKKRDMTVYRCRNCSILLGNSDFVITAAEGQKVVLFSEVDNALMSTSSKVSKSSVDYGCTYHIVQCSQCTEEIGKYYISVVEKFKHLDKIYRLDLSAIESMKMSVSCDRTEKHPNAEIEELRSKIDDIVMMLMSSNLDQLRIKESVVSLGGLLANVKQDVEQLQKVTQDQTNQ